MKTIILLTALLLPATVHANPLGMWLAMGSAGTLTANSINGHTAISSAGILDTGTGSGTLSAGTITVDAECNSPDAGYENYATIYLTVDGTDRDSLLCTDGSGVTTSTLSFAASAGVGAVRVWANFGGTGTFSANNFSIPVE